MSERHHNDQKDIVVDGVDDAVVADAYPEAGSTPKRSGSRRPWIFREQSDRTSDTGLDIPVELAHGLRCRRPYARNADDPHPDVAHR